MQPESKQRIMGYFIEEAQEHLNTIQQGLQNLQNAVEDPDRIAELFRAAHSIKGGAGMLELSNIQKIAHKLEDDFKVLQNATVQVDGKLETLLGQVVEVLQELLTLEIEADPARVQKGERSYEQIQPAIAELEKHIHHLSRSPSPVKRTPQPVQKAAQMGDRTVSQLGSAKHRRSEEDSARKLIFKSDVPRLLQEMLHLFKQPSYQTARERMQQICRELIQAGEQFDLQSWCNLIQTAAQTIANPQNLNRSLGPILIQEIQTARELVLAGRAEDITLSPQLEAPIPPEQPLTGSTHELIQDCNPIKTNDNPMSNPRSNSPANPDNSQNRDRDNSPSRAPDKKEKWSEDKKSSKPTYHSGPEVGAAELNSLADLFEGKGSYFDESWYEEEAMEEPNATTSETIPELPSDPLELIQTSDSDFDDLLFEATELGSPNTGDSDDENLFGLDGLSDEIDDSFGMEPPQNSASAKPTRSANDKIDDLGDLFEAVATEELKDPDDWEQLWDEESPEAPTQIQLSPEPPLESALAADDSEFNDLLEIADPNSSEGLEWEDNLDLGLESESPIESEDFADLFGESTSSATASTPNTGDGSDRTETAPTEEDDFADLFDDDISESSSTLESTAASDPQEDWLEFEEADSSSSASMFEEIEGLFDEAQLEEPTANDNALDTEFESELFGLDMGDPADTGVADLGTQDASGILDALDEEFASADLEWELDETGTEETNDFYQNLEELFETPIEEVSESESDNSWLTSPSSDRRGGATSEPAEVDGDFDALFGESEPEPQKPRSLTGKAQIPTLNPESALGIADGAFAELDVLLAIGSYQASFDELEVLLGGDDSHKTAGSGVAADGRGSFASDRSSRAVTVQLDGGSAESGKANDDFADMEELMASADIGHRATGGRVKTPRPFEQTMRVPVRQLDNLSNLVGELVVNRNSIEQNQERMRQFLDNLLHQVSQLTDVGQRMQDLYERSLLEISLLASRQNYHFMGGHSQNNNGESDWSALEMDRFTPFHTLSQDILELIVRVRESASDIEFLVDETEQVTRQLRQVTTQLQEGLTRSRMVPFSQTADRLPRGVRDNAIKFGKQVELHVEGRETLIDKMILEQLTDPMTHLVNNALAHGIESPDERQKKGKSPLGRITIRAFHQGNQTVISVSDDGAGIDPEKVKAKALQRRLITPDRAKIMSRLDVYDLLFMAGFSTRDQADDLAGRGVGMDVVRTRLSEIRGVVNIDSNLGKGTTFTIRLPLTLSISKALCCISDRARIAFPMDGVEDMLDVPRDRIQIKDDGQMFIPWRDTMLPFRHLRELLVYNRHLGRGGVYGANPEEDIISVVVLRSAGNYLALQVDQVLGEQEIVIKQLEGPVPKPVGVAGATVMGDGRIVAIGDVLELIDLAAGRLRREGAGTLWDEAPVAMVQPEPMVEAAIEPTVLIVDDSITVRELLSMTFNKAGYRVEQARDGQEAWEKMRSGLPCDLVFCDIEMPRMDGLELLSRMQKDPQLLNLPIAMLTSRGADKHRQMAISMGASGYFTKPYLEESLLEAAGRMLKGEKLVSAKAEG